jgi:hypothetical protein
MRHEEFDLATQHGALFVIDRTPARAVSLEPVQVTFRVHLEENKPRGMDETGYSGWFRVAQDNITGQGTCMMLETLEGRVKWEQTERGIRAAIPVRRSALSTLYVPLVVFWLSAVVLHYWHLFTGTHSDIVEFRLQLIAIGLYFIGFGFFLCWLAFTYTGETVVLLDPEKLTIQRRVLGIELVTRCFPTDKVSQLVYVGTARLGRDRAFVNPNTSRLEFQMDDRKYSFARGIGQAEASALIEQMLDVYKFPECYYA